MMATAQGPGWAAVADTSSIHALEDSEDRRFASDFISRPDLSARATTTLGSIATPNPTLIFPTYLSPPASSAAIYAQGRERRPISATNAQISPDMTCDNDAKTRRLVALPAFSFNPGASLVQNSDPTTFLSPFITPNSESTRPVPSPSRPSRHGHRRGGSEFVGGSIRAGNSIAVMSTSPTKSESGFALSPGLAPPTRGHRRGLSGAVSANDLPLLGSLPRSDMPRGSSAPNSPTSFCFMPDIPIPAHAQDVGLLDSIQPCEESKRPNVGTEDAATPPIHATASSEAECGGSPESPGQVRAARTRVGFSEKLEFIPRPLSLISSDTSSTATARPGHSVSGSISSVASIASPCGREWSTMSGREAVNESRPSTAGAIMERMTNPRPGDDMKTSPKRRNSIPTLLAIAETQATGDAMLGSVSKPPKRWSIFGFEPAFMSTASPKKQRPMSSSSSESAFKAISGTCSTDHDSDSTETGRETGSANGQMSKKMSKKKRVKGWAGSMLPLKPKGLKKLHKTGDGQLPTPPGSIDALDDDDEGMEGTELVSAHSPVFHLVARDEVDVCNKVGARGQVKDETPHPMIDLDAALGPFNTPLPYNAEWEAAQRASGSAGKKRMHSAQGIKGFSGPGMHYHRRAESAPDLPPFEAGRSDMTRYSSSSTMADVFEEDEEEDEGATVSAIKTSSPMGGLATPPNLGSPESSARVSSTSPLKETTERDDQRLASRADEAMRPSSVAVKVVENSRAVEEDQHIIFRTSHGNQTTNESVLPPAKKASDIRDKASVCAHVTQQCGSSTASGSPCPMSIGSASHHPLLSPLSLDGQHIATASSSITGKHSFQSLLMGEPGPEVRISTDFDWRSLNSSNLTMTRDISFIPSQRMSQPSLREQRPVSVSSAAFGRRRSSLVSLSRLISSAHGERSKLSMEVRLENEAESKKSKLTGSKTRQRLGRMMQFWKPSKDSP